MAPKYSIVCAAYNVEKYIDATIASVIAQTEPDWELIVVDDGSTDATASRIRRYADDRILLIQQANGGVAAARNTALAAARGARFVILDADDLLHPAALVTLGAALDSGGAVASYGQCRIITDDGRVIGRAYRLRRGYPPSGDVLSFLLTRNIFLNGGHVCMVGAVAREIGGFRSDLPIAEDHEYWCRLAARGPIVFVGDEPPILDYRRRAQSLYRLKGRDPANLAPTREAIFGNPSIMGRFSPQQQRRMRRAAEATSFWIVGREHIRFGDWAKARPFLVKSLARKFHYKRAVVLLFALCGGAPAFIQARVLELQKYEFLL